MQISEHDIYNFATQIVGQYGEAAILEAMYRIESYRDLDDEEGMIVWFKIANAIEDLQEHEYTEVTQH